MQLGIEGLPSVVSESTAISKFNETDNPLVYTNSENALDWVSENLACTDLPRKIELFKNKAKFRELVKPLYPEFFFKEVPVAELNSLNIKEVPLPFIIKPSVGFFSMGVHVVSSVEGWEEAKASIAAELDSLKGLYPESVYSAESFIIEQCIYGEEYAVDAYYNSQGEAIILGIFKHLFSSGEDVSDRVYISSKSIIESNLQQFKALLEKVGELGNIKNFPIHAEIRRDDTGQLQFIEINPLRFGGWCTTADLTSMAYGLNPYEAYFSQAKPNWPELLEGKEGKNFSLIVLDNSTGVPGDEISSFNYQSLQSKFDNIIELREVDFNAYPVFGFVFAEVKQDDLSELDYILRSDLSEFISTAAKE